MKKKDKVLSERQTQFWLYVDWCHTAEETVNTQSAHEWVKANNGNLKELLEDIRSTT